MNFNTHYDLTGQHAFLSASKYYWLNYDDQKIAESYLNHLAVQKGTELHEIACSLIRNNIQLPKTKETLNMYVNDAIGYRMTPEQILYYSPNCYGTADAISYRKGQLRIHDLKTGSTPASIHQLEIYAALFFLEYKEIPLEKTKTELRIYQSNDILIHNPTAEETKAIMDRIISADGILEKLKQEV